MSRKRLTEESARLGWINGGWVDKRIPNEAVQAAIVQNQIIIDMDEFLPWLAGRVGTYRMLQGAADSVPTPADELAHVKRLIEDIENLETRISNLPPGIYAHASYAGLKAWGYGFHDLPRSLSENLLRMSAALKYAEKAIAPHARGKGGRKRNHHRDDLLNEVARKLADIGGTGKSVARQCAADVLRACGVPVPDDGRARPNKGRLGKTGEK